jgi:hypothetical protein
LMANGLAKSVKETLTNTSLWSITLSNMWMWKGTTDMLWLVLWSWVNYCQVDRKLLGCCFWRTIGNHGSSLWPIYEVRWEHHPKQHHPSQDQVHESWTEEDAMENWGNGAIQSASQGGASGRTNCWVKDRGSKLN